jgi:ribosomal protein S18 acetylase RimI-like enzyme
MDYLEELGGLALGSRLRRLSERISQEVAAIYAQQNIKFDPRWFPVFHFIAGRKEASIVEIARAIGITHPAVNQIAQEMLAADLIVAEADTRDKRKRNLSLSKKGQKLYAELLDSWRVIRMSVAEAIDECGHELILALEGMEEALNRKNLLSRFQQNSGNLTKAIEIVNFEPAYKEDFRKLNESWIRKFFHIEEADTEILSRPENIIADGGTIFFARLGEKIVGTCALVKVDKSTYEIAKMAVSEDFQGMGIGRILLEACLERARATKATCVTLETNTKLAAAIQLYKKAGFKPVPHRDAHESKFSRVDLVMKLDLVS